MPSLRLSKVSLVRTAASHTLHLPKPLHRADGRHVLPASFVTMTAIAALLLPPRMASAEPLGGTVISGSAGITQAGSVTNINQSSGKAIINWQGFSVAPQETVNFNQPNSASVTLNRVIGNETSVISGALNANGQIFIVNSAGVLFGKGAQVNVSGLVASTRDISNADFLAGNYTFSGGSSAAVVNQGRIRAGQGGYVALLGKTVSNDGVISANLGTVAMSAGDKITLNFGGNSLLDVTIDKGTLNALVENKRAIRANGGQVIMTAKAADAVLSAQVNNSGVIQARTMAALKGGAGVRATAHKGSIKLYAYGGTTNVSGKLDASALKGGDGGTIETSGDKVHIADTAVITTKSTSGKTGTWTIDPDGFTIGVGGDITGAQLAAQLASNNVAILSTNGTGTDGNINVNDALSWSANTLTLNATNNIFVNNQMTATGTAGFVAHYGTGINADGTPMGLYTNQGGVNGSFAAKFDFSGTGGFVMNGEAYTVINDVAGLAAARGNPNGRYILGADLGALTSANWSTALDGGGAFTGKFNGLGHTISSFNTAGTSLFGIIGSGALISNIGVNNANGNPDPTNTKTSAGLFADINQGSVINSFVSGGDAGGTLTVANSVTSAGLFVGTNSGFISQSYVANLSLDNVIQAGGGFVGTNQTGGHITESSVRADTTINSAGYFVSGNASTIAFTGGFAGVNDGLIDKSYTQIGLNLDPAASSAISGGFVGLNKGTVDQSYSTLDTPNSAESLFGNFIGGFVGQNIGTISNAYTTSLTDQGSSNWLAGFAYRNSGTIRDSYSLSYGFGVPPQYGFVADNSGGTIINSYWNSGFASLLVDGAGSTATMLDGTQVDVFSKYVGFDPAVWAAAGSGLPILRNTPVYVSSSSSNLAVYGDVIRVIQTLQTQGLQGSGGIFSAPGDSVANPAALLPFTIATSSGYIDAGTSAAGAVLSSSRYANIKGVVTVKPKTLSLSDVIADKTYDGTTSAAFTAPGTGFLLGLVGNQLVNVTYTSASFADKNAGANKVVNISGVLSDGANGGKASNYVLASTTTADIAQKSVSATATGNDKVYDGTTVDTVSTQLHGVVTGDSVSVDYAAAFADKNAGQGKTVTVSGLSLIGADSGNYILQNSSALTTANITPRPLNLSGAKPADGSTSVAAGDLVATNVIAGDQVQLGGSATIASAASGIQPITNLSTLTQNNSNYTLVGSVGSVVVGGGNLVLDHVASGAASISTAGSTTTITQTTDKAILDWQQFSIGAGATVDFVQPSATSVVLNRVIGNETSVIAGALNANGRVFIINSAGVLFKAGSSVNAGALVASTLNVNDSDFNAGNYVFVAAGGSGSVIAGGDIVIADGGFVALASGNGVSQSGTVTASSGKVLLTAVNSLTLSLNPTNRGMDGYAVGAMSGSTSAGGNINVAATAGNGGLVETAGTAVDISGLTLNTGNSGTWSYHKSGGISVGAGGTFTSQFIQDNLAARNLSLNATGGDVVVIDAVSWAANTILTLAATNNININAQITATGVNAGLTMSYGGDYNILTPASFSGVGASAPANQQYASITLSGANASLTINGDVYTLIHNMGDFGDPAKINGGTGNFALAQDITASGTFSSAIVPTLNGVLAGLGHTISNLTIRNLTDGTNTGLIGKAEAHSTIRDIGLLNVDVTGAISSGFVGEGALVGQNFANVSHAYSTGTVSGQSNVGGLIGFNGNPSAAGNTISDSYSDATVSGAGAIGGLIGGAWFVDITRSHATGQITGTGTSGGGFVGTATGVNITDSYATGNVNGGVGTEFGGLVGSWSGGGQPAFIKNSFATGSVTGGYLLGGLVGTMSATFGDMTIENSYHAIGDVTGNQVPVSSIRDGIGGLVGNVSSLSPNQAFIKNSYAIGDGARHGVVKFAGANGGDAGGLVGSWTGPGLIDNSYAIVDVSGSTSGAGAGGLVGTISFGSITNSSAAGNVSGNMSVGGLAGSNGQGSTISNSFASGNVSGTGNSIGGLVGSNVGTITGSHASGSVTGLGANSATGGIAGTNIGLIVDSYTTGAIRGPAGLTGGLAGANINAGEIHNSYYNGDLNPGLPLDNAPPPPPGSSGNPGVVDGGGALTGSQLSDIASYANGTITQVQANRDAAAAAAAAAAEAAARAAAEAAARAAAEAAARAAAEAAAQAAARTAAAQRANTAVRAANASTTNAETSAATPPDATMSTAGTQAATSSSSSKVNADLKSVDDTIKADDERERRRVVSAVRTARRAGSGRGGGGLGATIRSIDIDGQRFDLQNNTKKGTGP